MNNFNYFNPVKIVFGQNKFKDLQKYIGNRRALLLTSKGFSNRGVVGELEKATVYPLKIIDTISPNPTLQQLANLYKEINHEQIDVIVALGGGSVIDAAKVLSVVSPCGTFKLVENLIKEDKHQSYRLLPIVAVPTTSGTSSEITPWATVWDTEGKRKYSLQLDDLWCETAIYDPLLTLTLPKNITVQTALDALSHSLESLWNKRRSYVTRDHAIQAIKIIIEVLPLLVNDLTNIHLRERMMYASIKAGLAFSNTQTAIAHAISYDLTLLKKIPHGIACSITLPSILEVVKGQNLFTDIETEELIRELYELDLNSWMENLNVSCSFSEYRINKADLSKIKGNLSNISRSRNSLVDVDRLFEELYLKCEKF